VARTIARINNPATAWLFNETFCVDVALNQAEILSSLIEEEMSLGDMMTLVKIRRGRYSLVEEKIPAGAPGLGIPIKDLPLPANCVIAAIIRKGQIVVPRGITSFEEGDEVLAVVDAEGAVELARLFGASPAA
jgi:trk system potassium uptake protein TrkA